MNKQRSNTVGVIVGVILIFIGLGYVGDQFGFWYFSVFFRGWWTLFLIVPGISSMINSGFKSHNVMLTALGVYLFLWSNHLIYFRFTFQLLLAIILIYLGAKMIFSKSEKNYGNHHSTIKNDTKDIYNEHHIVIKKVFESARMAFEHKVYTCKIDCTFSTLTVDLVHADLKELKSVNIDCVFGSVSVYIPHNANVIVKRDNIFGSCNYPANDSNNDLEIFINESCVFGNIQIIRVHA